jgi:hypothetical protein
MKKKFQFVLLMLVSLFAIGANAAPMAFSVNSDSGNLVTDDSLFQIDLSSGNDQFRGELISGIESRIDTEGLAISPDGTLWGVDDDAGTLFPISKENGAIKYQDEIPLAGFQAGGGHDFGMTFSCDNSLYITSVKTQTLYHTSMDGSSEVIGSEGALAVNISAIAAIGSPSRLFGLGNGQFQDGTSDAPNLYSINTTTGATTLIGPLGAQAGEYNQAGLAFGSDGKLWAITDRRIINNKIANLGSQILQIDIDTGTATMVSETSEVGFESLAVAPPAACNIARLTGHSDHAIPTLSSAGRLLAVFLMLLAGMTVLRRRFS